jgi:YHS domain-containing protein
LARFILIFILILAAARFIWRLIETVMRAAGPFGSAQGGPGRGGRGGAPPVAVKMQPCPVCGTYVVPGKAISAVSNGATVYFCSDKCRAEYQSR